ncbi:MAG: hypothetical protein RI963_3365 [Planctomycetota bacterium]
MRNPRNEFGIIELGVTPKPLERFGGHSLRGNRRDLQFALSPSAVPPAIHFIGVALHVSGTARAVRCPAVCKNLGSGKSRTFFSTHRAACAAPLLWLDSPGGLRRSATVAGLTGRLAPLRYCGSTHRAACAAPLLWLDSPGGLRRSALVAGGLVLGTYPGFGIRTLIRSQAKYGIGLISMHRFMRCSKPLVAATLVEARPGPRSRSMPRVRRGSRPSRMPPALRAAGTATRRGCSMGATRSRSRS